MPEPHLPSETGRYARKGLHGSEEAFDPRHNLALKPTLVLRRDVVGGLHLWREAVARPHQGFSYNDNSLFMSEALFADVMTQRLQGLAASHRGVFDTDDSRQGGSPSHDPPAARFATARLTRAARRRQPRWHRPSDIPLG